MLAADEREVVEIAIGGHVERMELVGHSVWGTIRRTPNRDAYFRLIPSDRGITAEMRDEIRRWCGRPPQPAIATVSQATQETFDGGSWLVIRYEASAATTLAEALADGAPVVRLTAVAAAARGLSGWSRRLGAGLVLTPCDVLLRDGEPVLLAMPKWGIPPPEMLLDHPASVQHMAPEVVRGRADEALSAAADLYALGTALISCFVRLPDEGPEDALVRIANGTMYAPERCASRLPFWMQKVEAVDAAVAMARRLVVHQPADRAQADPGSVEEQIRRCIAAMDPVAAVTRLWEAHAGERAIELANDIMLDRASYDLYVLAARISWHGLGRSLDALSLLDKAVELEPERQEAYVEQVDLICASRRDIVTQLEAAINSSFADRLDETMLNAFGRLPPDRQARSEADVAEYLIHRERHAEATQFIHRRLHDDDGTLQWWKFELMLAYAQAFLELGRLDDYAQIVNAAKHGLVHVRASAAVSEERIQACGARLTRLELHACDRRGGGT